MVDDFAIRDDSGEEAARAVEADEATTNQWVALRATVEKIEALELELSRLKSQ